MRCSSCGFENPDQAVYCMKCGAKILAQRDHGCMQPTDRLVHETERAVSVITGSLGSMLIALGALILIVAVIALLTDHLAGGVLGFILGAMLLYLGGGVHKNEARMAAAKAQYAPRVYQNTEIREHEIVKVKCHYCGALNPDGARNCGSCGSVL